MVHFRSFGCLGVGLDENLSWEPHINSISEKVSAGMRILKRTKLFVPNETLQTIYKELIQPYLTIVLHLGIMRGVTKTKITKIPNWSRKGFDWSKL